MMPATRARQAWSRQTCAALPDNSCSRGTPRSPDIRAMCDEIRHRGPDHEGYYVEGRCGIGMRRLSIIDLATGPQPISNEDGTRLDGVQRRDLQLSANCARIWFAAAIASRPIATPRCWCISTKNKASAAFEKLRGMFAYAIWDSRGRSMLLVRDRFGKKPLYLRRRSRGPVFRERAEVPARGRRSAGAGPRSAAALLPAQLHSRSLEPYRAVRKAAPGGWLRYHADGRVEQAAIGRCPRRSEEADPRV